MEKNLIISIILAVLVLISIVQTLQLATLNSRISRNFESVKTASQSVPTSSAGISGDGAELPSGGENLPGMVGGC